MRLLSFFSNDYHLKHRMLKVIYEEHHYSNRVKEYPKDFAIKYSEFRSHFTTISKVKMNKLVSELQVQKMIKFYPFGEGDPRFGLEKKGEQAFVDKRFQKEGTQHKIDFFRSPQMIIAIVIGLITLGGILYPLLKAIGGK